jgi:predicted alpha/beta-hydrolase family hydrolase
MQTRGLIVYARAMPAEHITIPIPGAEPVSGLWQAPAQPTACLVLAHGAGAGMTHRAMAATADGLSDLGVTTLRYQFPYVERGGKRVDPPPVAHAAVRAAVAEAHRRAGELPLFAGGRSFGGRMTSQAQALSSLDGVRGLVFFAFPLHPAGKPSDDRAAHLSKVAIPMLFLQGANDALAETGLLRGVVERLGPLASLELVADADHSFHVPAKTGRKDADVLADLLRTAAAWMSAHA